jgi:uncharacterized protein (TIGR02246 family)
MDAEHIRSIIIIARDAWINGNADNFVDLFLSDGEFIVPGQSLTGQLAIRQAMVNFTAAYSEIQIQIHRILIDGEQAAVEWTWCDMENKSGLRQYAEDAILVDFREGKIQRWREYIDRVNVP